MKSLVYIFLIIILFTNYLVMAQNEDPTSTLIICGTEEELNKAGQAKISSAPIGGKHITASGIIKALVVYIQFASDTNSVPYWDTGDPPDFLGTLIDSTTSENSTNYSNVTYFYDQMSFGDLQLIGNEYHVVLPETESWYKSHSYGRTDLIEEALTELDSQIDYSIYDNWGSSTDYTHTDSSDGTVDMIIASFRYIDLYKDIMYWNGEASLGYGSSFNLDGVTIKVGYGTNSGSGITCNYRISQSWFTTVVRHEFAHWLLGRSHPFGGGAQHHIWSILGGGARCANAYDRERLGWITVNEITSTTLNDTLQDFITTGDAYKYHPSNGSTNEYYYFENHQKISIYDNDSVDDQEKGIYILHQSGEYNGTNNIRCLTSSGCYNWDNPFWVTKPSEWGPGPDLPAYRLLSENTNGYNNRDKLYNTDGKWEWLFVLATDSINYTTGDFWKGYNFDEAFTENSHS